MIAGPGGDDAPRDARFDAVEAAMRGWVDRGFLAGASWAILCGRDVLDLRWIGLAERESGVPLRRDHLFRAFSSTKLVTSIAVLQLVEDGRLTLDDPVSRWIPQLADLRVLRTGATSIDDTEPARRPITVRHLLSHASGLSYGLLDPGTPMYRAYTERKVLSDARTLAELVDTLATLPLAFHPGESWEYSIGIDVLGHLVETLTGGRLGDAFQARILDPLGMRDTGFVVPEAGHGRLAALYVGDPLDPTKPGLRRLDDTPYAGAYLKPMPRQSGGGGLVSSLDDQAALLRALVPGDQALLRADTLAAMHANQLADGVWLRFPATGVARGKGHGLAGAVTAEEGSLDAPGSRGALQWGGMAGTHWWMSPAQGLSAVLMTQRYMGFWNPYWWDFQKRVAAAAG
ncbi:MAG: serine hydrolase [Burkholderiaceae bacterium]|nr:serine hydrolase [Burkholderiales bacterium]MCZ8337990.1 serine hydrolase [Burkholderiaceae bacterium]